MQRRHARLARLVLPALVAASPLAADVRLPALLSDGAVLQQQSDCPLWGRAEPGETIRVEASWTDAVALAVADADGRWRTTIATPAAGGPHVLTFRGNDVVTVSDVLVGEVWICSGQSNMEWTLGPGVGDGIADHERLVAQADFPRIRLFDVANRSALAPADDCEGSWRACSPDTARTFSAIGYLFGRALHLELDVPIGLVSSCWGGTKVEAWTSAQALRATRWFGAELDRVVAARSDPASIDVRPLQEAWWRAFEEREPGLRERWERAELDDASWAGAPVPAPHSASGLGDHDGATWYRTRVDVPAAWAGEELRLELGPIDDADLCWWNGEPIGSTRTGGWRQPRSYAVPAAAVRAGSNVLALCAIDVLGEGGFVGAPEQHALVRPSTDERIALAGTWRRRPSASLVELGAFPFHTWFTQNTPSALYNGMLAPLAPWAIRGAIWYQGESNLREARRYRTLFPALVADWRRAFGRGDFPFYYVQIAPFAYPHDEGHAAELREAQTSALTVANVGMAVTMDVGEPYDIHPLDKEPVAERLARIALAETYGRADRPWQSPLPAGHAVDGASVRIAFEHCAGGLVARGGALTCFTVAGADRVFHAAEARIAPGGHALVVSSPAVPAPLAVRFAWGAADEPNLFNSAGLPAPSFRTDDWERPGENR